MRYNAVTEVPKQNEHAIIVVSIDANIIAPGEEFEALPEIYIIFITENDILKRNLPIYHINRMISETGEPFER